MVNFAPKRNATSMSWTPFPTLLKFFLDPYPQRVYGRTGGRTVTSFPNFLVVHRFPFFPLYNVDICFLYYLPDGI